MKTSDVAILGGACFLGYILLSKKSDTQQQGSGTTIIPVGGGSDLGSIIAPLFALLGNAKEAAPIIISGGASDSGFDIKGWVDKLTDATGLITGLKDTITEQAGKIKNLEETIKVWGEGAGGMGESEVIKAVEEYLKKFGKSGDDDNSPSVPTGGGSSWPDVLADIPSWGKGALAVGVGIGTTAVAGAGAYSIIEGVKAAAPAAQGFSGWIGRLFKSFGPTGGDTLSIIPPPQLLYSERVVERQRAGHATIFDPIISLWDNLGPNSFNKPPSVVPPDIQLAAQEASAGIPEQPVINPVNYAVRPESGGSHDAPVKSYIPTLSVPSEGVV